MSNLTVEKAMERLRRGLYAKTSMDAYEFIYAEIDRLTARVAELEHPSEATGVRALVEKQARDEGLWFTAQTAPEAYLQQELRRLHGAIEAARPHNSGEG